MVFLYETKNIDDIYVFNNLTNFTELEKIYNLGFSFNDDENKI